MSFFFSECNVLLHRLSALQLSFYPCACAPGRSAKYIDIRWRFVGLGFQRENMAYIIRWCFHFLTAGTTLSEACSSSLQYRCVCVCVCVCIVLLKSLSPWQRHRGFWHRLSCWRSLLPLLLSLLISTHFLSLRLQIFKNHITIPTAARGAEMKGGNNLSLSLSASYPSANYSELGIFSRLIWVRRILMLWLSSFFPKMIQLVFSTANTVKLFF